MMAINAVVNRFVREGRTTIIMSHQTKKLEGISAAIDLNEKPEPRVTYYSQDNEPRGTETRQDDDDAA